MTRILLIACGGGIGSLLRYLVSGWGQQLTGSVFPLGTLIVNIIGCFLIGVIAVTLTGPILLREELRLGLVIGLLGGFTTFSSFGWETIALIEDGEWWAAGLNVGLSNVLGLTAVWLGYRLAESWQGG